jgi:glycosyltransferase involved in cell wall biosynthesis
MSASLVSVIIPNYNYARFLPEAIDSVLGQTYPNVEIIVVDDGSTDNSEEVLKGYGERLRWFRQSNRGVSAARNYGIEQSRGELLAFMDADDMWRPEKLERQVRMFENPAVGMVYCGLQYISTEGELLGQNLSGRSGQVLKGVALLQPPGVPASGSSALISRACFDKVGLFDTALSTSADWDMWRRIACHYEIAIVPEPLVLYRLHGSAMHRNVELFERDMLRAFSSMFEDPAASQIHPLKRHCYGNLYLTLSGSYLHAGQWRKSVKYALRSIYTWPPSLAYLLSFPYRRVRRRPNLGAGDLYP